MLRRFVLLLTCFVCTLDGKSHENNSRVGEIKNGKVHYSVWMKEWQARSIFRVGCILNVKGEWLEVKKFSWWRVHYIKKEKFQYSK